MSIDHRLRKLFRLPEKVQNQDQEAPYGFEPVELFYWNHRLQQTCFHPPEFLQELEPEQQIELLEIWVETLQRYRRTLPKLFEDRRPPKGSAKIIPLLRGGRSF